MITCSNCGNTVTSTVNKFSHWVGDHPEYIVVSRCCEAHIASTPLEEHDGEEIDEDDFDTTIDNTDEY